MSKDVGMLWIALMMLIGNCGKYIGMVLGIALVGLVARDAIVLLDFIHLSQARGRTLFDAIIESFCRGLAGDL